MPQSGHHEMAEPTPAPNPAAAPATETPPAEPPTPAPEGEQPVVDKPEGEEPKAAEPQIAEEVLAKAAEKWAAAKVKAANQTMAAARRAERAANLLKGENERLKADNARLGNELRDSGGWKADPRAVVTAFGGLKPFLEALGAAGGEPAAETADQRLDRLERERAEEREQAKKSTQQASVEASKRNVFAALDAEPARFAYAKTRIGKAEVWEAVSAYYELHGSCPDAAVYHLADATEKRLREEFNAPSDLTGPRSTETQRGATAATQAAHAAKNGGKTLTNASTSGAPAQRAYSLDPEERRRQVNDDMRAAGEL